MRSQSRSARWLSGTALPVFPMRVARRTLWTLYLGNLFTSIGLWFFLPLLPIFIGRKGGSAALVGAVFAAGLLASAAIRYPAGWAAVGLAPDRSWWPRCRRMRCCFSPT